MSTIIIPHTNKFINKANSLTRELRAIVSASARVEPVTKKIITRNATREFTRAGIALTNTAGNFDSIASPIAGGIGEMSMAVMFWVPSFVTGSSGKYLCGNDGYSTRLAVSDYSAGAGVGSVYYYHPDYSGATYAETTSAKIKLGLNVLVSTCKRNNFHRLFHNGVLAASSTPSDYNLQCQNIFALGQKAGTGMPLFAGLWARALSDAESISLSKNPWQLFAPIRDKILPISSTFTHLTNYKKFNFHFFEDY